MLKYKKGCKTCELVKNNKPLLNRIYNTNHFVPSSEDSLRQVYLDYADYMSYPALLNHVRKHQFINDSQYREHMMRNAAKIAESKVIREVYQAKSVQDAVINAGMEKLENGEMDINANQLLRAAKDKSDAEAKMRDQNIAIAEMVAFFASGEDEKETVKRGKVIDLDDYDPAVPITENITSRQN